MVIGGKTTNINDGHHDATTAVATVSSPTNTNNATQSSPKAAMARGVVET
jgi:hypothetical protein